MPVQITIRNVPDEVRDKLAAKASLAGKSMQEFLRAELETIANGPDMDEWIAKVRARKAASKSNVTTEMILEAIREGRSERSG